MIELPLFFMDACLIPGAVLSLHIFEPRYKAMMAKCMQGVARFGIVKIRSNAQQSESEIVGCSAEIVLSTARETEEGRWFCDVVGRKRFVVLDCHGNDDLHGLVFGKVNFVDDVSYVTPSPESVETKILLEYGRDLAFRSYEVGALDFAKASRWSGGDDDMSLSFWLACILPVSWDVKQQLLVLNSTKLRLAQTVLLLEGLGRSSSIDFSAIQKRHNLPILKYVIKNVMTKFKSDHSFGRVPVARHAVLNRRCRLQNEAVADMPLAEDD
mmetsp:Transcript_14978/g.25581  ORF Transcript_14978/g.25581 Transcript_14978/m.25581 type:complete len:269 (+) Transcript_14978:41-847(+)